MSNVILFPFMRGEKKFEIRVVLLRGAAWFVAQDVCRALGLANTHMAISPLPEDERDKVNLIDSIGRSRATPVISKSGLYRLVLRSDKEEAREFQDWVVRVVIPSIEETGSYSVPGVTSVADDRLVAAVSEGAREAASQACHAIVPPLIAAIGVAEENRKKFEGVVTVRLDGVDKRFDALEDAIACLPAQYRRFPSPVDKKLRKYHIIINRGICQVTGMLVVDLNTGEWLRDERGRPLAQGHHVDGRDDVSFTNAYPLAVSGHVLAHKSRELFNKIQTVLAPAFHNAVMHEEKSEAEKAERKKNEWNQWALDHPERIARAGSVSDMAIQGSLFSDRDMTDPDDKAA